MTGYLTFYDSAWPVSPPPESDGVAGYIGGDTPHVWTAEDWAGQKARYRLPVFVRSNPRGIAGIVPDVNAAVDRLKAIGAPRGTLVAWDMETAADKAYIAGVYTGLLAHGWKLVVYGSDSTIMGNDNPDGLYWAADWTGAAHMAGRSVMTQWVSFAAYDESEAERGLPFWDTQAKPPAPPAKPKTAPAAAATVPIEITQDSIVIGATVNGKPVSFVLDTGDAIGPTFTAADAQRLGLVQGQPFGVEGAGGASSAYQTTASVTFDGITYADEPSAIDLDLQGQSLLGLPWFLARTSEVTFDWAARTLSLVPVARPA